jgi:hypothetical protein
MINTIARNSLGFQVPFFNADSYQIPEEKIATFRAWLPMDYEDGAATKVFMPRIQVGVAKEKEEPKEAYIQRCRHIVQGVQAIIKG